MRRERSKRTLKLRLLAFVLALALAWYSLNPSPGIVIRRKREAEPPDEKKRNAEPRSMPTAVPVALRPAAGLPPPADEDDFEWPEFIDA